MKTIQVVAAIIMDGNRFLATQRADGNNAGGWEFPGGKVEPGETREEAIVREIHEELDARIVVDEFLTTVEFDYPAFRLVMDCFLVHLDSEYELLEHSAAKWLTTETADSVNWLPADVLVVDALKKRLR